MPRKRIIKACIAIMIAGAILPMLSCESAPVHQGPKQVIAVGIFGNSTDKKLGKEFLTALTDEYITALIKTGRFSVVERSRLEEVLREHELGMTGLLKTSDAIQIGKMLQAPFVVISSISAFNAEKSNLVDDTVFGYNRINIKIVLNSRVIGTQSGASVAAASIVHNPSRSIIRVSLDTQTSLVKYGGSIDDLDPAVKEELIKAVKLLSKDLSTQKF
jgi:curli biogenesis system outer membrane secretion channel CsgG